MGTGNNNCITNRNWIRLEMNMRARKDSEWGKTKMQLISHNPRVLGQGEEKVEQEIKQLERRKRSCERESFSESIYNKYSTGSGCSQFDLKSPIFRVKESHLIWTFDKKRSGTSPSYLAFDVPCFFPWSSLVPYRTLTFFKTWE